MSGSKSEADRQFRLLQTPLNPLLRERGFKRSNRVYNRTVGDGLVQVIEFLVEQAYKDSPTGLKYDPLVRVQFGIHVPCMWSVEHPSHPLTPDRAVGVQHCGVRTGLAELMIRDGHPDFPWAVPMVEAVKDVPFLTSLVLDKGLTFLARFHSYDAVVNELQTPDESQRVLGAHRAALVCAVIRTVQGRTEEARELFHQARAKQKPPPRNPELSKVLGTTESDWERINLRFSGHVDQIQAALDPTFSPATGASPGPTKTPAERPAPQLDAATRAVVQAELNRMALCGIALNPDFTVDDLADGLSKDELQTNPWAETLIVLGTEGPGAPSRPLCNRVWFLDTESIEDTGDYVAILARLGLLTEGALALEQLKDHVDSDGGDNWVQFRFQGRKIRWRAEANDDWLDTQIIVRYDELLQDSGLDMGIYASMKDYGQQALLIGLTTAEYEVFQSHSAVAILRVREAWGEQPMSSSSNELYTELKPDMISLVEPLFDLGERLIREMGHFLPMGAVLHDASEIKLVGADPREGNEETDATKVLPLLHTGLRHEARELEARAVAVLEDVTITPEGQPSTRAIKVLFEHQRQFTAAHYLPYKKKLFRGYTFGPAFSIPAEPEVRAWSTDNDSR